MPTEQTIPLNKLIPSPDNVRRKTKDDAIGELAASMAVHKLRQNLNVKPCADGERYEVVAGGRRLRALKMLAKAKTIAKDEPVRCLVLDEGDDPAEISLAENVVRVAMNPMDEFEAFDALVNGERPLGAEEVAARFGVTPVLVRRRLKLANVSPKLRALYRKDEIDLDHLMAFAISDDHNAQEEVWASLPSWSRTPHGIRAALTRETVSFRDRVAKFVGQEAYQAAGGDIMRDLFDESGEDAFLTDRLLLLKLASEKLEGLAAGIRAEGWKWIKVEVEPDHQTQYGWATPQTNDDPEADTEQYSPEDMARAGVRLRINHAGQVTIERGLIHPDDIQKPEADEEAVKGQAVKLKPRSGQLSAVLIEDLTAHRTAALRLELARNPSVALAATVHALALDVCYRDAHRFHTTESCLALRASSEPLDRHTTALEDCTAHSALAEAGERWSSLLPDDPEALFGWCLDQPQDLLLDLLAFVAGLSVNAVWAKHDVPNSPRLRHADALTEALSLDMTKHWTPSVEGFYGRVSKATLVEIVTEAKAPIPVSISGLKKAEGARCVHKAMAGSSWLPAPLGPVTLSPSDNAA